MLYGIGGLFLVLACFSFLKKADFLFLKHRSVEDFTQEYDLQSARQITGLSLLVLGFTFILTGLYPSMYYLLIGGVLISVGIQQVGMSRYARYQGFLKTATSKKKAAKPILILTSLLSIVVLGMVAWILFMGKVTVRMDERQIEVSATLTPSKTVLYEQIEELYLNDDFTFGHRQFGIGTSKISSGKFNNEKLGNYDLYAYSQNKVVIVLDTKEGTVAFNQEDVKQTKDIYEKLKDKIDL